MRDPVRFRPALLSFFLLFILSCMETPLPEDGTIALPHIDSQEVRENPNNALSAVVQVSASNAASITLELRDRSGKVHSSPVVTMLRNPVDVVILGLEGEREYPSRVIAGAADGRTAGGRAFAFVTDALPDDLPPLSVTTNTRPSPGYVLLAMPSSHQPNQPYAFMVDNGGRVVWYRRLVGFVLDFQKQPDGSYTVFSSLDTSGGRFLQMDNLGNVIREYRSQATPETGPHELRLRDDGYCLFGIEFREMDLTPLGGVPNALVRGLTVEFHRTGGTSFVWNTFDHFRVEDALPDVPLTGPTVNPWHGNAIEVDTDGHLLVSFRSMGEITKIHSTTGEILWRMGGRNNQFTFVNDPLQGFSHQHGIRRLPNGNIILFDNGNLHLPPTSRAVEYRLNEETRVAELVWEFRPQPPVFSATLGFAQRLPNGNTMVCFGRAQRIFEVDRAGTVVWELRIDQPQLYAYRALRVGSLY